MRSPYKDRAGPHTRNAGIQGTRSAVRGTRSAYRSTFLVFTHSQRIVTWQKKRRLRKSKTREIDTSCEWSTRHFRRSEAMGCRRERTRRIRGQAEVHTRRPHFNNRHDLWISLLLGNWLADLKIRVNRGREFEPCRQAAASRQGRRQSRRHDRKRTFDRRLVVVGIPTDRPARAHCVRALFITTPFAACGRASRSQGPEAITSTSVRTCGSTSVALEEEVDDGQLHAANSRDPFALAVIRNLSTRSIRRSKRDHGL